MKKIELRDAAAFTCDECGVDNLVELISVEHESLSEDLRESIRAEIQEMADLGVEIVVEAKLRPSTVRCFRCATAYEVLGEERG